METLNVLVLSHILLSTHHFPNQTGPQSLSQTPSTWTRLTGKPWSFHNHSWAAVADQGAAPCLNELTADLQIYKGDRNENNMQRTAKKRHSLELHRGRCISKKWKEFSMNVVKVSNAQSGKQGWPQGQGGQSGQHEHRPRRNSWIIGQEGSMMQCTHPIALTRTHISWTHPSSPLHQLADPIRLKSSSHQ